MPVLAFGKNFSTGEPIFKAKTEQEFTHDIIKVYAEQLEKKREALKALSDETVHKEAQQILPPNPADPKDVGWTFLVSTRDPQREKLVEIMKPLAIHRRMDKPETYLKYSCGVENDSLRWMDWLKKHYFKKGVPHKGKIPKYVLIVGGPDQVPFRFQSMLQCCAFVGRVDFDSLKDLRTYVKKVIRLETADEPTTKREALFFATDHGKNDATFYSRRNMVEPMAEWVHKELEYDTWELIGEEATKSNLKDVFKRSKPALVYTASHGADATAEPLSILKRFGGAICCHQRPRDKFIDTLWSAEDIPEDIPFLEGSIFFQFACYSYGTPKTSDYAHWFEQESHSIKRDMISAIPKKLLSLKHGPIAFIGHTDTALLQGIIDLQSLGMKGKWHSNIVSFKEAVERILHLLPAGMGMERMSDKFNYANMAIANTMDLDRMGAVHWNNRYYESFVENWLFRNDAQNFHVFGDPGVRVRVK